MPKPTAKTKRQRVSLDDCLWPIFVEACGGVCCACKRPPSEVGPLQRGHIHRHADNGPVDLENLMPLCASCNGENNKKYNMDDDRHPDWRSNFLKLLAGNLKVKMVRREGVAPFPKNEEGCSTLNPKNSLHSKQVISWNDVIFEIDSELRQPLIPGSDTLPLDEILAVVEELIAAGIRQGVPIPVPDDKCQEAVKRLIRRAGRKDFLAARDEFLRRRDWYDQDEKTGRVTRVGGDPWPRFVNGFSVYLKLAKARPPEPTIEQIKAAEIAYAKSRWFGPPIEKKPETKKSRLLASIALLGARLVKGELRSFPKAYWNEVARIKKLVEVASDNDELLDLYESQLRMASVISRWQETDAEPESSELE